MQGSTIKINTSEIRRENWVNSKAENKHTFIQENTNDCLVCMLKLSLTIGKFIGVSPISCECRHTCRKSNIFASFNVSLKFTFVTLCYVLLVTTCVSFNIYSIIKLNLKSETKFTTLQLCIMALFEISALGVYLNVLFKNKRRVRELNGLSAIVNNKSFHGFAFVFDDTSNKYIKESVVRYVYTVFIIILIQVIQLLAFIYIYGYEYTILQAISACLCLTTQVSYILQIILKIRILNIMYCKVHDELQSNLNKAISMENNSKNQIRKVPSILTKLRKIHRFYCVTTLNVQHVNNQLNPFILYDFIVSVLMFILCYYLVISTWILGKDQTPVSILMEFKLYTTIALMFYILNMLEGLLESVSI